MQILQFKRVGFGYPGQALILSGANLILSEGERAIIIGANASGKSTIASLAAGLLTPQSGEIIRKNDLGQDIRVGIVFQNSRLQMIGSTVEEDLSFGLSVLRYSPTRIRSKVDEYLHIFGLEHKRHFYGHQLSGGELRRLALASVLILEPELLILDEPLSMIDSYNQAVFLSYLKQNINKSTTVLWLDHDLRNLRYSEKYYLFSREHQISPLTLEHLKNPAFLAEVGIEPAPLQHLEWEFPDRVSQSVLGPEKIKFSDVER